MKHEESVVDPYIAATFIWSMMILVNRLQRWLDGEETRDARGRSVGALQIKTLNVSFYGDVHDIRHGDIKCFCPPFMLATLRKFGIPKVELGSFVIQGADTVEDEKQMFLERLVKARRQGTSSSLEEGSDASQALNTEGR